MRNSTLLYGRILLWIALQARNLNENLEKNLQPESLNYNLNANLNAYRLRIYLINTNIIF